MKKYQLFPYGFRIWMILTTCAIMALSVKYQNFDARFSCGGWYGVGFPVSFLCDYGAGGSPIHGWGRIDSTDFPFISLQGLLADVVFYFALLSGLVWLVRIFVDRNDLQPFQVHRLMVLLSIIFFVGYFFSSLVSESSRINAQDYLFGKPPTAVPSPTLIGKLPSEIIPF